MSAKHCPLPNRVREEFANFVSKRYSGNCIHYMGFFFFFLKSECERACVCIYVFVRERERKCVWEKKEHACVCVAGCEDDE